MPHLLCPFLEARPNATTSNGLQIAQCLNFQSHGVFRITVYPSRTRGAVDYSGLPRVTVAESNSCPSWLGGWSLQGCTPLLSIFVVSLLIPCGSKFTRPMKGLLQSFCLPVSLWINSRDINPRGTPNNAGEVKRERQLIDREWKIT